MVTWTRKDVPGFVRWTCPGVGQIMAFESGLMIQIYGKIWRVADSEEETEQVAVLCFERMSWTDYRATVAVLRAAWTASRELRRQAA